MRFVALALVVAQGKADLARTASAAAQVRIDAANEVGAVTGTPAEMAQAG
jgi:hypothetical protein